MPYSLHQEPISYKNFQIFPGNAETLNLRVEPFDPADEFRGILRSRLTKAKYHVPVTQQGSNAGYLAMEIPEFQLEPIGFTYQVHKKVNDSWAVVAAGTIFGVQEKLTSEVG